LDLIRRSFLFTPTAKSLTGPTQPLPSSPVDHFQCYLVRRSPGSPRFTPIHGIGIQDQFGPHTVDLLRPRYLCVPADKNGEDPTAPQDSQSLLCYKSRHRARFGTQNVFTNNQFGPVSQPLTRRMEFCVPSTLGAP